MCNINILEIKLLLLNLRGGGGYFLDTVLHCRSEDARTINIRAVDPRYRARDMRTRRTV